jgi:FAD/FMN-containing dehydrogenase
VVTSPEFALHPLTTVYGGNLFYPMERAAEVLDLFSRWVETEVAQAVQAHLAYVAEAMSPYKTGATYINFLELDGASPERVRAAYSPEDWERPVELKDRYDPDNLFRFNRNIPPSTTGG